MTSPSQLQDLVADVVHVHPTAHIEFNPMPSGVCYLWVWFDEGRSFVLEFDPKRGTGVSENTADSPAFTGHDFAFASLEDGIGAFKRLLSKAASQLNPVALAA